MRRIPVEKSVEKAGGSLLATATDADEFGYYGSVDRLFWVAVSHADETVA